MKYLRLSFFLNCVAFAASAFSEPELPANLAPIKEVTALDKLVKNGSWPQFQLSVVNEEGPVGYIAKHDDRGIVSVTKPDRNGIARLFGLSKPITNLLALKMAEDGLFSLDQTIYEFISNSVKKDDLASTLKKFAEPDSDVWRITIRDLMNHTAGYANNADFIAPGDLAKTYSRRGLFGINCFAGKSRTPLGDLVSELNSLPLVAAPGSKFGLSVSTDVLGFLLELAGNQRLEDLLRNYVAMPLGMSDLHIELPEAKQDRMMDLYEPLIKTYPVPGAYQRYQPFSRLPTSDQKAYLEKECISAGSGLMASHADLENLIEMLLRGGALENGERFLDKESMDLYFFDQLEGKFEGNPLRNTVPFARRDSLSMGFFIKDMKLENETRNTIYYYTDYSGSFLWVDRQNGVGGVLLTQIFPTDHLVFDKTIRGIQREFL